MGKRRDRHKEIIQEAMLGIPKLMQMTQFHTAQKMPSVLRGVPDLNIQWQGVNFWAEIKPLYGNYMRDQMSDKQWTWFHERYSTECFGNYNRYGIVTDSQELIDFLFGTSGEAVVIPDYYWGRYDRWRDRHG
jgi:hypothetical protein